MRAFRLLVRASALGAMTLTYYACFVSGRVIRWNRGNTWRNLWFRRWARGVCRIVGVRITVNGVPPQDALIVSNHISYIDIPVLASHVDAVFVAKAEILDWPIIGRVCKGIDTIFIDRNSKRDVVKVGEEMEARLAAGLGVVFFPEGTSSSGESVLPFKSSLLEVAARDRVPVHCATVRYSVPDNEPPATESVAWVGDAHFVRHAIGLLQLSEIRAEVVFGDGTVTESDRKILAAKLQERIASALT